jgi:uncharacterized protein YgbK (DUF1537 family)
VQALDRLVITADDTTGALESAAAAADRGWRATVVHTLAPDGHDGCVVVDLRSRHGSPNVAARRLTTVLRMAAVRAHKIDSTLRGNWAAELTAAIQMGRRVLMVPAFPAAGRVCRGGTVTEHDVDLLLTDHARDPRSPVVTSRPASLLAGADELPTTADVAAWLAGDGAVAVADAVDDDHLARVVALAARHDVLIAGTAAVVAALADVLRPCAPMVHAHDRAVRQPVLVVCGSMHPTARGQIDALDPAIRVLVPTLARQPDPWAVVASLAAEAHRLIASTQTGTVVLVGGDTAQAFIGDRAVHVFGSLGVGIAVGQILIDGRPCDVVTKPGSFGARNTLVDLMHHHSTGPTT